jgi:hypothetical protein
MLGPGAWGMPGVSGLTVESYMWRCMARTHVVGAIGGVLRGAAVHLIDQFHCRHVLHRSICGCSTSPGKATAALDAVPRCPVALV